MGYSFFLHSLIVCFLLDEGAPKMSDSEDEDASEVTWAHAVNHRAALRKELAGPVDILEADVSMGYVIGSDVELPLPVMAHPPDTFSDISLGEWLDTLVAEGPGKGIKLDFKSIEVVEPSLLLLQSRSAQLNCTIWLNADILRGPVDSDDLPVNRTLFLRLCNQYFPKAILSVGWTTRWITSSPSPWHYEWRHVRQMADTIRCFGYESRYPTFTFPVRGVFASKSIKQLQWLLETIPGSSLTVWSGKPDPLLLQDLLRIRASFPKHRVFYDVPDRLKRPFSMMKHTKVYDPDQQGTFKSNEWMTLTRGSDHLCSSNTYVSSNAAVFGSSLTTAILLKKLLFVDASHPLQANGKIQFFFDSDKLVRGTHELTIVITDVSLFSKNSSSTGGEVDLSSSDSDVLWKALNESQLYAFKYDFSGNSPDSRIFKIDTSVDLSFQAWAVPWDEMTEDRTLEEIISRGTPEISSRKRMVLPKGPFMIGFISSGDGNAVVYDLEINGTKESISRVQSASSTLCMSLVVIGLTIVIGYMIKRYL